VTVDATATLVWLAPAPPTLEQRDALAAWARAHGVGLSGPADEPYPPIPVDPQVGATVEDLLELARAAMAAADGAAIDRALASAESLLRAHAEIPQAAWLMAEVERSRATRWRRIPPMDVDAADRAWARAESLDGGRTAGLGEPMGAAHPATVDLRVDGPRGTALRIDGNAAAFGDLSLGAGLHAIVVVQEGAPVWASWVDLATPNSSVRTITRPPVPCSIDDLQRVALTGESIRPDRVRCSQWVAAESATRAGAIRVATCRRDRCDPLVEWRSADAAGAGAKLPVQERGSRGGAEVSTRAWPPWATWTLITVGIAVTAGAIILASGVWRPAPSETRFVNGGLVDGP
jgi:hypothetical protein